MLRNVFAVAVLLATMVLPAPAVAASAQRLVYDVSHSRYGSIGTYTNAVQKNGDVTTVTTEARIRVSILGIVLYRQDADRQERWDGGKLVSFRGVTKTNSRTIEISGAANGDGFLINSTEGAVVAPANVRVANPWSPDILRSEVVFTPDRGRLEDVEVKEAGETPITIDGRRISAKRYEFNSPYGEKRYEIWMDRQNTPVRFIFFLRSGSVTMTLDS